MRKLIICVIICFVLISCCFSKSKTYNQPLRENDSIVTEYNFNSKTLNIYRKSEDGEELIFSKELIWGHWQFCEDNTQLIFWEYSNGEKQVVYLDLKTGYIKELNIPYDHFVMNRSFDYYVVPRKENNNLFFSVYNSKNNKKLRDIYWPLSNEEYTRDSIYNLSVSSILYNNYDFKAYISTDGSCCAIGIFKSDSQTVETLYEFEDGNDEEISDKYEELLSKDFVNRRVK